MPAQNTPKIEGGHGGKGGDGHTGGDGGVGRGVHMNMTDVHRFAHIRGGDGGDGGKGVGKGKTKGGNGGEGEAPRLFNGLIELPAHTKVPRVSIDTFCDEYHLATLKKGLKKHKFNSVGGLLLVSETDLQKLKFGPGEIAEMKGALRQFCRANKIKTLD
ncbi:hypothetical protein MIND_00872300 [Mycena indigotica]|uniref:Uncharacterized protein n=1 Tax=Mycena indigotica TaxID=2126181 RepID=A0A8H6W170_9AGAR|nr:uncharacterized protein MIND_00872300 [Mycena indigotica]KAF7299236.1 hypothetical protein MIND_00872300 [Mycena indigotica]